MNIYGVDQSTGRRTGLILDIPFNISGLAYGAGVVYGAGRSEDKYGFYSVDIYSGGSQLLGSWDNAASATSPGIVEALVYSSFGAADPSGHDIYTVSMLGDLWGLDIDTGNATNVASIGLRDVRGMAAASEADTIFGEVLWVANWEMVAGEQVVRLYAVRRDTPAPPTLIGNVGGQALNLNISAMTHLSGRTLLALADGVMYRLIVTAELNPAGRAKDAADRTESDFNWGVRHVAVGDTQVERSHGIALVPVDTGIAVGLPSVPLNPRVPEPIYNAFKMDCDPPASSGGSRIFRYVYNLRPTTPPDEGWQTEFAEDQDPVTNQLLTEHIWSQALLIGQEVEMRVAAENETGIGPYTAPIPVIPQSVPDTPREFYIRGVADGLAYMHFANPEYNGGSPLDNWQLEYREVGATGTTVVDIANSSLTAANLAANITPVIMGKGIPVQDATDVTAFIIRNLDVTKTYEGRLRVNNDAGYSEFTSPWDLFKGVDERGTPDSRKPLPPTECRMGTINPGQPLWIVMRCIPAPPARDLINGEAKEYVFELWSGRLGPGGARLGEKVVSANQQRTFGVPFGGEENIKGYGISFRPADGVVRGTRYFGRVGTRNDAGASVAWCRTIPDSLVIGPQQITRIPDLLWNPTMADASEGYLSFTEPTPAGDIAGYNIRSNDNDGDYGAPAPAVVVNAAGRERRIAISGIPAGVRRTWQVMATDSRAGAEAADWSNEASSANIPITFPIAGLKVITLSGTKTKDGFTVGAPALPAGEALLGAGEAIVDWDRIDSDPNIARFGYWQVDIVKVPSDSKTFSSGQIPFSTYHRQGELANGENYDATLTAFTRDGVAAGSETVRFNSCDVPAAPTIESVSVPEETDDITVAFTEQEDSTETIPATIESELAWTDPSGRTGTVKGASSPLVYEPPVAFDTGRWRFVVRSRNQAGWGDSSAPNTPLASEIPTRPPLPDAPEVDRAPIAIRVGVGETKRVSIASWFKSTEALSYTVRSSSGNITAALSGTTLSLTGVRPGMSNVLVTARNSAGRAARHTVVVTAAYGDVAYPHDIVGAAFNADIRGMAVSSASGRNLFWITDYTGGKKGTYRTYFYDVNSRSLVASGAWQRDSKDRSRDFYGLHLSGTTLYFLNAKKEDIYKMSASASVGNPTKDFDLRGKNAEPFALYLTGDGTRLGGRIVVLDEDDNDWFSYGFAGGRVDRGEYTFPLQEGSVIPDCITYSHAAQIILYANANVVYRRTGRSASSGADRRLWSPPSGETIKGLAPIGRFLYVLTLSGTTARIHRVAI